MLFLGASLMTAVPAIISTNPSVVTSDLTAPGSDAIYETIIWTANGGAAAAAAVSRGVFPLNHPVMQGEVLYVRINGAGALTMYFSLNPDG